MFPTGVSKPKMLCILAGMDQFMVQTAETVESPQLQSMQVVDISFVAQMQFTMVQTSQLTTEVPQLPFVFRWSMPLLCRSCLPSLLLSTTGAQGSDSAENRRGPAVAVHQVRPMGIPQLQYFLVVDVPVGRSCRFFGCGSSFSFDNVVVIPVVAQIQYSVFPFTTEILQLQYIDKVTDVFVQVQQVVRSRGRQPSSHSCSR